MKWIWWLWLSLCGLPACAQPLPAADPQAVLNQHVAFANEGLHVLWHLQPALEDLHRRTCLAQQGAAVSLAFPARRLLHHELYQGVLLGICTRAQGATDAQTNLRRLYLQLSRRAHELPPEAEQALRPLRETLFGYLMELLHRCDSLQARPQPAQQWASLARIETLYQHIDQAVADLRAALLRYHAPMPADLRVPYRLIELARRSALALRAGEQARLQHLRDSLTEHLHALRVRMRRLPDSSALFPVSERQGYRYLLRYGQRLLLRLDSTLLGWSPTAQPAHYAAVVALLNHQQYGLLAYYNQFVTLAHQPLRQVVELPPWLRLASPPAPLRPLARRWSLVPSLPVPPVATRLAEEMPQVHLVVLVDVSASMGQHNRLARLQAALRQLIAQLRPGDRLTLLRYARGVQTLVEAGGPAQRAQLQRAVASLSAGGDTQLGRGLRRAYRLGRQHGLPQGHNVLLIATDGAVKLSGRMRRRVAREADALTLSVWLLADKLAPQRRAALQALTRQGGGALIEGETPRLLRRLTRQN